MTKTELETAAFDYHLPKKLIATHPPKERASSRLLVVNRATGEIVHAKIGDFHSFVSDRDLCVFNDTRVMPARFYSTDGKKELLRLDFQDERRWRCLVRPGKKLRVGHTVEIGETTGTVEEILENGDRIISFDQAVDVSAHGKLALPHYMERESEPMDEARYQTVFAAQDGAVAAPTAGLHFTEAMMAQLPHAFVTLHVGVGTFQPVREALITNHRMHTESYELSADAASQIKAANRVISVGTTVTRVLEHCGRSGELELGKGETNIFIYPPYEFQVVDVLMTNFHLPQSTLLMLVSAFAGKELILEAYAKAIESEYRFFSYGDAMLIV
ncbi:MAG: tRNA preQ1(34) S-adenosylmethionine ribosyltransferase-isomerase QueA [Verrucomicrobiales bacterium]|jgi:S-adenosylmethionine:tRNA ribosyltransferase-isomerase|nr:tRNA preQ1(34) S-adenosylmethionine ribosyltransferase-isomerase QueA [Verrucomicrobiales bacterium]